jgi:hypothetical protein
MHSRSMSFSVILSKFFKIYDSFGSKTWNNCTMSLLERYDLQKVDSRARQKRFQKNHSILYGIRCCEYVQSNILFVTTIM